jgi:hypothetical protein
LSLNVLDVNLAYAFDKFIISNSITHNMDSDFYILGSFGTACDSKTNNTVYVLNNNAGMIHQYDENWNYLRYFHSDWPYFMIALNGGGVIKIIVTARYGIFSLDSKLDFIAFFDDYNALYKRMYYNESSDRLFVCASGTGYNRIDIFNHELKFIKSISTYSNSPIDIEVHNDSMYIVTTKTILVYQNEANIKNLSTICSKIVSSIIDTYGNLALLCNPDTVYLYSLNGTYLGASFKTLVPMVIDMSFDSHGDLILVTGNGIFILESPKSAVTVNNGDISVDRNCILNSKL